MQEQNKTKKDIFDKIMGLPVLRIFEPFYKKHKEVLLYLFFGGLSFCVSMFTYWYFTEVVGQNELIGNIFSWILAVLFSFITNRIWVFEAKVQGVGGFFRQMFSFFGGRIATLILEEIILFVFITLLLFPSMAIKTVAQIIVIVLNYIVSKLFVFKKRD